MDRRQRATRFVEGLAEKFFKETHGGFVSAKDKKSYLMKSFSLLAQGRLKRELVKYRSLYCKRFRRCIKNLKENQDAPGDHDVVNCGQSLQNFEDTLTVSVDQGTSKMEVAKQETKEMPSCSKEITDNTPASDNQHGKACSPKKQSISCIPPDSPNETRADWTSIKDHCVKRSMSVNELCTEMTVLFHQCVNASLNDKMNHAVRFFRKEVAGILKHKNSARASDLANALHSIMLFFHFKCDILRTDHKQQLLCKDAAYRCLMATMFSLYSSLNMIITRCDPDKSHRLARHTLFKACLLLESKELLMDVVLQLLVKPEPIDAPYLHPTIMHVLKHPPNPCTPSSYIKHVLVCRLARYILPRDLYPEITKQLEFNRSLLPPHGLLKWLADLCPHLSCELSTNAKDHLMTSYFLQIASHDLCNELQQNLYNHLGSVSLGEAQKSSGMMDDGADSPDCTGAINIDGDAVILESDVEEVSGNHSKDTSARRGQTESSKQTDQPANQFYRDPSRIVQSLGVQDQRVSVVGKTLSQNDDEGQPSEEVLVISQEIELMDQRSQGASTQVPIISKTKKGNAFRKGQKRQVNANFPDVCKKVNGNSRNEASTARNSHQGSDEMKSKEVLITVQDSELDEEQQEGKPCNEIAVSKKAEARCEEISKNVKIPPSAGKPHDAVEVVFGTVQEKGSSEKQLECAGDDLRMEKEVKKSEQDLQQVGNVTPVPPSPNQGEKAQETVVCQKSSNPMEDIAISDSCSEESVDIIYDTETDHSDYLTLRKARHLRKMFPPQDPSKVRSIGSCVVTRSRYRKSMPDAHSVKPLMDRTPKKHQSTGKESDECQEGSPVFKYTRDKLVHIDKNRGSIGKAKKIDTGNEVFPIIQEVRESRISTNERDLSNDLDSKTSQANEVISSCGRTARVVNHRKKTESSNLPNMYDAPSIQMTEQSVISFDSSENGILPSCGVRSGLRRSPRRPKHQDKADVLGVSSGDSYRSEFSSLAKGSKNAGGDDPTCLGTSAKKGKPNNSLKLKEEESREDNPVDTAKSDSLVDHSQVSNRFASNLQRSCRRKDLEEKSLSSAEKGFPDSDTSFRENLRQSRKSVAQKSHSSNRNDVDQVVTPRQQQFLPCRNAKGRFVSRENDSSCKGHNRENCPVSLESSHPRVRSLRKRSFSESFADQSLCSTNIPASIPTSAENAALHSRSSSNVGIDPPGTQEFDPILPQSESPARSNNVNGRSSGRMKTDGKGSPARPKTSGDSFSESRTKDDEDIPQRSEGTRSLTSGDSGTRTVSTQYSPRSSKVSSQHRLCSSPRVHLVRKALDFE
ncbi:uncharacterized protein LOC121408644 isoform X2 [Lytechinus variegatus]|uniref:uncharacterized protein LOC121408644 isoform X2 n=1 Tax=Lytechinus variegatus TaxID=7654 RepID=UPI001BB1A32A|nr:uncharacterized protein LOC121408644 isoform X2 [Lytechinus variegatus]